MRFDGRVGFDQELWGGLVTRGLAGKVGGRSRRRQWAPHSNPADLCVGHFRLTVPALAADGTCIPEFNL